MPATLFALPTTPAAVKRALNDPAVIRIARETVALHAATATGHNGFKRYTASGRRACLYACFDASPDLRAAFVKASETSASHAHTVIAAVLAAFDCLDNASATPQQALAVHTANLAELIAAGTDADALLIACPCMPNANASVRHCAKHDQKPSKPSKPSK